MRASLAGGGALAVGAQRVQGVVGEQAAPDEVPEGFEGFAGVAAAGAVVQLLEEGGAVAAQVVDDLLASRSTLACSRVGAVLARRTGQRVASFSAR